MSLWLEVFLFQILFLAFSSASQRNLIHNRRVGVVHNRNIGTSALSSITGKRSNIIRCCSTKSCIYDSQSKLKTSNFTKLRSRQPATLSSPILSATTDTISETENTVSINSMTDTFSETATDLDTNTTLLGITTTFDLETTVTASLNFSTDSNSQSNNLAETSEATTTSSFTTLPTTSKSTTTTEELASTTAEEITSTTVEQVTTTTTLLTATMPTIRNISTTTLMSNPTLSTKTSIINTNISTTTSKSSSTLSTIMPIITTNKTSIATVPALTTTTKSTSSMAAMTSTTRGSTTTIDPTLVGKCKPETNTAVNRSLFVTNGAIADPNMHGFWLDACGQTLLLGKSLGTWQQNSAKCFSLNMQPFAFESKQKLECMKLQAKSWMYNINYWTGGMKDLASEKLSWCNVNGSVPWQQGVLPLANLTKDQNCIQMQISKANGNISIKDRRCSDTLIFACQGPPTKPPKCSSPVCPNVTCQEDPLLFTMFGSDKALTIKNRTLHGKWVTQKLRTYLFSAQNNTKTYLDAMKTCCNLGMSLMSLDAKHKYDALANIFNSSQMGGEAQNLTFWTSGTDEGCESNFGYCSAKRLFRNETKWMPGQPDNAGGKENYVAVHIWRDMRSVLLADYEGQTKFRYICEKRRNPQSKNEKQAIVDECTIIYGVTSTEIDLLRKATTLDKRMKCFVQCVGDAIGLIVGGMIVESKVFAILETMALQNMSELMKNMGIVDECNNKSTGMDVCDKAYELAKCARDKATTVFDQIIKDLDNQTAQSDGLFTKSTGCASNETCIVDKPLKDQLNALNLNASTCGNFVNKTWACKCTDLKTYIVGYQGPLIHSLAVSFCCKVGMRLVTPSNYVRATNCVNPLLQWTTWKNRCWAITNSVVVDVTSGYSYNCETQTTFFPTKLNPSHIIRFGANGAYDGGPLVSYNTLFNGKPEINALGEFSIGAFICEEF
ncbi:uncharacterized protein LOC132203084 isoform X2 [Neocloeon triangulifer]|uniref:uncharacterized protein LOC132203084 isoform X2 n=1 Tax=Neocloeon triangulifer TaxID=2078957 RepID=UPI00286F2D40|nr:uncharacterized protein LOC132203084 isoform X2 [Neocloeon triangulifer]